MGILRVASGVFDDGLWLDVSESLCTGDASGRTATSSGVSFSLGVSVCCMTEGGDGYVGAMKCSD